MVDNATVSAETKAYKPIPVIHEFIDEQGNDCMNECIKANYDRVKAEVKMIVESEKQRIASNPQLSHLLNKH